MIYLIIGGIILVLVGGFAYLKYYPVQMEKKSNFKNIDVPTFKEIYAQDPSAVILDVRTEGEYNRGNIDKALHIDMLQNDFAAKVEGLDKEKTYLVYCKGGVRSAKAAAIMCDMGFSKVFNLQGGYDSWK